MYMKYNNDNAFYKTSDISLCASLVCYGYQVDAIDKDGGPRATFIIKRDDALDGVVQQYFTHKLSVDPLGFFYALKDLKTRIYHA